ncbi:MAG: hypothetical protein ACE144_13975 [Thermodesulfobacteriota bacterium]
MSKSESELRRAAFHEAGHAVACYLYDLPLKSIEIYKKRKDRPSPHVGGKTEFSRGRGSVHDQLFMLLAGPATESILCKGYYWGALSKNLHDVELAMSLSPPSMELRTFYDYVQEAMRDHEIWRMVEALAKELLTCGKLSSKKVKEVCDSTD